MRRRLIGALHGRIFQGVTFDGLDLYFEPSNLARVRESLQLVKDVDPLRWKRLQRYLPLLVETIDGSAFVDFLGTGFIDVGKRGPWGLAGSVVHELTHAYLHARWQVPYRGELKERHETICLKEEFRLYRRLIHAFDYDEVERREYLDRVEARNSRALRTRWWERTRWQRAVGLWRAYRAQERRQ